jgi:hypothetical protein
MLWDPRGDPLPKTPEGFDGVNERFNYLLEITFTELSKLYPQTHKTIIADSQDLITGLSRVM